MMKYLLVVYLLSWSCNGQYYEKRKEKEKKYVDPLRQKMYYNPNNGYEAYWADGEWHIRNPGDWDRSNQTTTRVPTVCGDECPYLYTAVGEICTRYPRNNSKIYCSDMKDHDYCGTKENFLIHNNYVTFKSYCAYLDAKCKAKKFDDKPMFIYQGKCIKDIRELYKPLTEARYPVSRLVYYLDEYNKHIRITYLPSNYTTTVTRSRING